ncbi:helix-turn-helix domain-containing protein [Shewanella submarina]|uniref:Helix-turn-helix domain-containing protein n=1 Tax=Shewanella submarina TaxID=2016376 RepID=A0ABV7G549_9GAMM|nr:helix-turn-helix domain-containing protein [Shewanella submarina]MCL1038325.1 helix-turn-helix domain-containing protein [Shewanella submarina]
MQLKHSDNLLRQIVLDSQLNCAERVVMMIIATHSRKQENGKWTAFPSMETICKISGLTEDTARKHRKSLESKGYIITSKEHVNGQSYFRNIYTIVVGALGFTIDNLKAATRKVGSKVARSSLVNAIKQGAKVFTVNGRRIKEPVIKSGTPYSKALSQLHRGSVDDFCRKVLSENWSKLSPTERHQARLFGVKL